MMEQRISLGSDSEYGAFTDERRLLSWKPGTLKAAKNSYRRRLRRIQKADTARRLVEAS